MSAPHSDELKRKIIAACEAIVWHASQVGHDRCWLDDYHVYEVVLGIPLPLSLPKRETCLILCKQYYDARFDPRQTSPPALFVLDNAYLDLMSEVDLEIEWQKIVAVTLVHYKVGDGLRSRDDDLRLYKVVSFDLAPNLIAPPKDEFERECEKFIDSRDVPLKLRE